MRLTLRFLLPCHSQLDWESRFWIPDQVGDDREEKKIMNDNNKKTIAVLFGGKSPEHEVSVITGLQVLENLDQTKFTGVPVYVAKDGRWFTSDFARSIENYKKLEDVISNSKEVILARLDSKVCLKSASKKIFSGGKNIQVDVIFPAFHSGLGENGGIQGLIENFDLPYVGSGILGSALGMDKVVMKQIFEYTNLPIAKYLWFWRTDLANKHVEIIQKIEHELKYPIFVKPSSAGSSIGIHKVENYQELANALEVAAVFDNKIIIEEGFENAREINISVIGNAGEKLETSVCEEVFAKGQFLDYQDKYIGGSKKSAGMASTKRKIPAEIPKEVAEKIADMAKLAFEALNCAGLVRIDFLYREKDKHIIILEVNTIPGSLAYYLWESSGLKFPEMISKLIDLAEKRFTDQQKNTTTFSSNILENFKTGLKTGVKS